MSGQVSNRGLQLKSRLLGVAIAGLVAISGGASAAQTQSAAQQGQALVAPGVFAVAAAAAEVPGLLDFYKGHGFEPVWTLDTSLGRARRQALFDALAMADLHGMPMQRYGGDAFLEDLRDVGGGRDLALTDVRMSRVFVQLAGDISFGILDPERVNPSYDRESERPGAGEILSAFVAADPAGFVRKLPPDSSEYIRLLKEKVRLERGARTGGWGRPVPLGEILRPGMSGGRVLALRDRLISTGYMTPTASPRYDEDLVQAVKRFQGDNALNRDGVAGPGTLAALNRSAQEQMRAVLVAMERERWFHKRREPRHVLVNLTDFTARIIENDEVSFETRAVIGKDEDGRRTPEFSDVMEYMVVNPTWHVPRSIVTKEYLPKLQRNSGAVSHLKFYDSRGREVNRGSINFRAYTERSFPYAMKQPPSARNALGLVKFMFPNSHNIYLHDTPSKDLFARDRRDFSHGCIRLQKPFDFAYALLSDQSRDPKGTFQRALNTGRETRIHLERPIPVHLIYRTAYTSAGGGITYRDDVYGRDARIWAALAKAGVALPEMGE